MKKTIIFILAVVLIISMLSITLVACNKKYSASSIKSGLEKAGYSVSSYSKEAFEKAYSNGVLKTSEMEGLQEVLYATKTIDEREDGIIILVYDSTKHAEIKDEQMFIMHDFGKKLAPDSDSSVYGTSNNVIWAGSQAAKSAAGIE